MATESDAARDRVLTARTDLAAELEVLEASVREAVDIPAKIRRSPAKAAAVVGGIGFVALKGPQRVFGAAKRVIRGPDAPLPKSMLPDEIEKTLQKLGSDGDKVRGTLERDFAGYLTHRERYARALRSRAVLWVLAPLAIRVARTGVETLLRVDQDALATRLAKVRERTTETIAHRNAGDADPTSEAMSEPDAVEDLTQIGG